MSDKTEVIIVADYPKYGSEFKECLVYVCGADIKTANTALERIKTNPNDDDKQFIRNGAVNFKVKEVKSEACWWNE